ncbi:hypothetical protein J2W76_003470 [Methylorubrum zatmanii]|nr:hypothetical protein [Methylorubrum zatmanii]MCP1553161.1 hypothetical protein [Methylorubrum extorquens]MCP1580527.1 hypothetical protein [Methylorubrum extorquens]
MLPATCGTKKGDWSPISNFIFPSSLDCERRFRYDGLGDIAPKLATDAAAAEMIVRLALDNEALSLERQQVIAALEADVTSGELTVASFPQEIERWRTPDPEGRLKAFSQVAARYLEDESV